MKTLYTNRIKVFLFYVEMINGCHTSSDEVNNAAHNRLSYTIFDNSMQYSVSCAAFI